MITFLLAVLVILFLGSAILDAIAQAFSFTVFANVSLFKLVIKLIKKIKSKTHDKKMRKQEREVTVHCPCSYDFRATPKYEDDWMVNCPYCGNKLRVDLSKTKKKKEKSKKTKL